MRRTPTKLATIQPLEKRLQELYERRAAVQSAIDKLKAVQLQRREIAAKVRRINGTTFFDLPTAA